ncbi:MAG: phenylacetate--CoA ligase family protein [Pseudomonadota bacterium]
MSDIKAHSIRLDTLAELRVSQWRPRQELLAGQRERLRELLIHAGKHSPYYRQLFAQAGFNPATGTLEQFASLPLLDKHTVRNRLDDLLMEGADKAQLGLHKTGGSTGQSLTVYFDKRWEERRNADAMRSDEWAGWRLGMQVGAVWGNPPVPASWYERFKSRWLYCMDLYLDTMNMSPQTMDAFAAQWRERGVDVLFGHAHSLYILADYLRTRGDHGIYPVGIIATSMMLLENERAVIEKVFGCPVTNRYGCEEVALIACECERHRGMHLNIEHLYIEFLNDRLEPAQPGETAEIVVTDLYNRAMPLIRYRVGDMGAYSERVCECGRGWPMLEQVIGRTADFLKRKDGSQVAGVSLVERTLTAIPGLAQMQLVQTALDCIEVNLVPGDDFTEATIEQLQAEFKLVFGADLRLNVHRLEQIPREASGKYRFAKCLV